jgi:Tol biopolymer transport system component
MSAVLDREPDWAALPSNIPPSVVRLLRRCLDKDMKRRLRDIGDARAELEAIPEPAIATREEHRARRWAPWLVSAVALAGLLVVGLRGPGAVAVDPVPMFSRVIRLTSGPALEFGPAIAPDGKWVAYLSNAGGRIALWVKFLSGGDATNLTANLPLELPSRIDIGGLAISPDGASIAFDAGSAPGTPANLFDSWIIPAPAGGAPRKLVERGRGTRWSPDGTRIAYIRAGAAAGDSLYVADADATNERRLLDVRGGMHMHWLAWSADGRHVYFVSTPTTTNLEPAEIHRVSVDGGTPEVVIKTARRAVFPAPLPDGTGLLYAANPSTAELGLWWMSLDAARVRRPITTAIGEYGELAVARDGQSFVSTFVDLRWTLMRVTLDASRPQAEPVSDGTTGDADPTMSLQGDRLVFSSSRGGNRSLWVADAGGGTPRPLTGGTSLDERPVISPDGKQIAFVSDRRGERAIWVMQSDGGAPRQLVVAQVLDGPSWSPDSRQLVYSTPVDEAPGLWIVDVATGSVRRLPTPGPAVFPVWSPRADLIAYVEARRPSAGQPSSSRTAFVTSSGVPVQPGLSESPNVLNGFLSWAPDGRQLAAFTDPGAATGVLWVLDTLGKQPARRVAGLPVGVRFRGATWSPDGKRIYFGQVHRSSDVVLYQR